MSLWSRTSAPKWAPCVRTSKGWEHAQTGELLVAFGDTSYTDPTDASTIAAMSLARNRKKYKSGDTIKFQVKFTEPVTVTGTPQVSFSVNGSGRLASFVDTNPGVNQAELLFEYQVQPTDSATAGQVTLGATAIAATKTFGTGTSGFTLTAKTAGTGGNSIALVLSKPAPSTSLSIGVSGSVITATLATDSGGAITTTASDLKSAIEASTPANALVAVSLTSSGAGLVAEQASTLLTGGVAAVSTTGITLNGGTIKDSDGTNATLTYGDAVVDVSAVTLN